MKIQQDNKEARELKTAAHWWGTLRYLCLMLCIIEKSHIEDNYINIIGKVKYVFIIIHKNIAKNIHIKCTKK